MPAKPFQSKAFQSKLLCSDLLQAHASLLGCLWHNEKACMQIQ
jgi:hypothetical protein